MQSHSTRLPTILLLFIVLACTGIGNLPAKQPNILFIAVDDLNHWVGYTGRNTQCKTPNIDRLAAMGVSFTNAHCAAPVSYTHLTLPTKRIV